MPRRWGSYWLIGALYHSLAETLQEPADRKRLEQRYAAASLAQLEEVLASLVQDARRMANA